MASKSVILQATSGVKYLDLENHISLVPKHQEVASLQVMYLCKFGPAFLKVHVLANMTCLYMPKLPNWAEQSGQFWEFMWQVHLKFTRNHLEKKKKKM
jgi:hypothetical protein